MGTSLSGMLMRQGGECERKREAEEARCCSAQQHFHVVSPRSCCMESLGGWGGGGGGGGGGVKVGCPVNGPAVTSVEAFLCLPVTLATTVMTVINATLSPRAGMVPLRRRDYFTD